MTQWARTIYQNSRSGGSGIIPMDKDDALFWAERHLDSETVEGLFGDIIEEA